MRTRRFAPPYHFRILFLEHKAFVHFTEFAGPKSRQCRKCAAKYLRQARKRLPQDLNRDSARSQRWVNLILAGYANFFFSLFGVVSPKTIGRVAPLSHAHFFNGFRAKDSALLRCRHLSLNFVGPASVSGPPPAAPSE